MAFLRTARLPLTVLLLLSALLLGACGGGHADTTAGDGATGLEAQQRDLNHVVEQVSPSVVQITTDRGLGSGIVFDGDGNIVTNAHVVEAASRLQVTLASGHTQPATLVGRWTPGDLAVIHTDPGGLHPATFADSNKVDVGDIVVAVGNPLGLRSSVTQGIVSSLGRTVGEGNGVTIPAAIQTSAAINPGNSGGALADIHGRVIGIPTLAATDPQLGGGAAPGIGFAIASSTVTRIAKQLVEHGSVSRSGRAALGVQVATKTGGGVVVVAVEDGGPAADAGIGRGDVILSIDGTPTPTAGALGSALAAHDPGDDVDVVVRAPDGQRHSHRVKLGDLAG